MNYLPYTLAFSHCLGIGPIRYKKLIEYFDNPENAYKASEKDITDALGSLVGKTFISFRKTFNAENIIQEYAKKTIAIVDQFSSYYPPQLKEITDPPICLYLKGNLEILQTPLDQLFAIVGSRKTTHYGETVTQKLTYELTQSDIVIVSGMALGIDTFAHTAALKNGKTIAVLGCGVDIVYPPSNKRLYDSISEKGIVLSEFPPKQTVLKGLFIARNRIISGLSFGTLVVEGTETSGALLTAKYALDQGREVYAIPGPITSYLSQAPNILIKNGARVVTKTSDIIETSPSLYISTPSNLSKDERTIFSILKENTFTADEVSLAIGKSITETLSILTSLEIASIVDKKPDGKYSIKIQ
jgi:DNA processing protein